MQLEKGETTDDRAKLFSFVQSQIKEDSISSLDSRF